MTREPEIYFVDGLAKRREFFIVIGYLHEFDLSQTEFSRIYTYNEGRWEHYETESQLVSVVRFELEGTPSYFFLGRRGEVTIIDRNGQREESIAGPGTGSGKLGYVSQIKEIGGALYVCGANRQVYRRGPKGWAPIHEEILDERVDEVNSSFGSIDGTDQNNIYTVGKCGEIFRYDGKRWKRCESPTNVRLERVLCASPDLVYICGNNGTLLRGARDTWEVFEAQDVDDNFWGLTIYKGEPYVAYDTGLMRFDGNQLVPVRVGLKPAPEFSRIYSTDDDVLWSFGGHDILRYDGRKWARFICPDNA